MKPKQAPNDTPLPSPHLEERVWNRLTLELPLNREDLASLICWETDSLGSDEQLVGDRIRASFFFPRELSAAHLEAEIRSICKAEGFHPERISKSTVEAPADLWMAKFREHFQGLQVGEFFVRPPWIAASSASIDLQIDPSHAFGTGTHESTQLILENLRSFLPQMRQLLDVGTGSGILALGAGKMAPDVELLGVDVDPDTLTVASRNARLNQFELPLRLAGPEAIQGRFDLVLANLTRPLLLSLSQELTRLTRYRLVTSGFTSDEAHLVEDCMLSNPDWELAGRFDKNGWVCLYFRSQQASGNRFNA